MKIVAVLHQGRLTAEFEFSYLKFISKKSVSENPAPINPSPRMIYHCNVSELETRLRAADFRAQQGITDMGTAEKKPIHKPKERSIIPRVNMHWIRGRVSARLDSRGLSLEKVGRRSGGNITDPLLSELGFSRQSSSGSISPRCSPLPRQE